MIKITVFSLMLSFDDYDSPFLIPSIKMFDLHMAHEMWLKRNCVDPR